MKKRRSSSRWISQTIGDQQLSLINFEHKSVAALVMAEMDTGFDVYYDNRWELTTDFAEWLVANTDLVADRKLLIIGAGAGTETLVLAEHARHIVVNDLSELSLSLCKEQLEENGFDNFTLLPGDYTSVVLPDDCDLAVACFSIYCPETATAVEAFLKRYDRDTIVVNEPLKAFRTFLKTTQRKYLPLGEWDGGVALRFLPDWAK